MPLTAMPMVSFAAEDISDYDISEETGITDAVSGADDTATVSVDESIPDYALEVDGDLYAATITWPATSGIKTYCKSTGNNTKVYKTATSTDGKYGTIYATDLITITGYDKSSKRYKASYPLSNGGTKSGYVAAADITGATYNVAQSTYTATAKTTTYRRTGGGSELGYISKGDKVYVLTSTSASYVQILYPVTASGGYKMGWIKSSDIPSNTPIGSPTSTKYTPRTTAPDSNNAYYYSSKNIFYASGYGMPNCTAYAYGRAYEILGTKPKLCSSNAGNWYGYNKSNKYYSYGSTPKLGAIACWSKSGAAGHVAVVEAINGNNVTISESHYYSKVVFDTKTMKKDSSNYLTSYNFQGYIYILN
jgi:surface antigen